MPIEERQAEAWYMSVTGFKKSEIARRFNISPAALNIWLNKQSEMRISRSESREEILENIVGTMEAIVDASWRGFRDLQGSTSLAGPTYLRTALDAAREIARLRGLDDRTTQAQRNVRVVVNIGRETPETIDAEVVEEE